MARRKHNDITLDSVTRSMRIRERRVFRGLPANPPRRRRTFKLKLFGFGRRRRRKLF